MRTLRTETRARPARRSGCNLRTRKSDGPLRTPQAPRSERDRPPPFPRPRLLLCRQGGTFAVTGARRRIQKPEVVSPLPAARQKRDARPAPRVPSSSPTGGPSGALARSTRAVSTTPKAAISTRPSTSLLCRWAGHLARWLLRSPAPEKQPHVGPTARAAKGASHSPAGDGCSWANPQVSSHPMAPRTGRVLSRKALMRGVTRLPSGAGAGCGRFLSVASMRPGSGDGRRPIVKSRRAGAA